MKTPPPLSFGDTSRPSCQCASCGHIYQGSGSVNICPNCNTLS